MKATPQLPAEVAARYELTGHTTRVYDTRLGYAVDLTKLTLAEAAELVALPGGFEFLRERLPAPAVAGDEATVPATKTGRVARTTRPARAKKTGARGGA